MYYFDGAILLIIASLFANLPVHEITSEPNNEAE